MNLEFNKSKDKKDILFIFDRLYYYNNFFTKTFNVDENKKIIVYNYSMNLFCNNIDRNIFGICCSYYNKEGFYFNSITGLKFDKNNKNERSKLRKIKR
jgi:hypothetical protein